MYLIRARELVDDLRSGMGDEELMEKYRLSPKGLQRVLKMLINKNAISHDELYDKSDAYKNLADILASRSTPRVYVPAAMRIATEDSSKEGFVRDLSETGIRVAGIPASEGEVLDLQMPLTELRGFSEVKLKGLCRWTKIQGKNKRYVVTGFEIAEISQDGMNVLRQLIELFRAKSVGKDRRLYTPLQSAKLRGSVPVSRDTSGPRMFSGTIHAVDILDFVQFLVLSGQSTLLEIRSPNGEESEVYIDAGRIVHAVHGGMQGKEALLACMNLPGGEFATHPWNDSGVYTIDEPGDLLLFEAAQWRDEVSWRDRREQHASAVGGELIQQTGSTSEELEPDTVWHSFAPFPVYDVDDLTQAGNIMEINSEGFLATGIVAAVGQKKNLLIHLEDFPDVYPFSFEAECRWVGFGQDGDPVARFAITDITEMGIKELQKALRPIAFLE